MALVPSDAVDPPLIAEVDMGGGFDPNSVTVRATVVQASTVFYDTPATLAPGDLVLEELLSEPILFEDQITDAFTDQYGLCGKSTDEAMLVIEAYRTLRDRGPYPADQVLKDFNGSFAFVVYDNKNGSVFAALSSDGGITMYWGMAADGSVAICDDLTVMKNSCGKSFAPFPNGCMFHSEGGLRSFERPMNKMKAMPRIDSEGIMCGSFFKVDSYAKISSMPRVGSWADWTSWKDSH